MKLLYNIRLLLNTLLINSYMAYINIYYSGNYKFDKYSVAFFICPVQRKM